MRVLRAALTQHSFIHFIDCDVVCLKEPTARHYQLYKQYDVVFQYDWSFENNQATKLFGYWQCTGNMSMRKSNGTMQLISKIEEYQRRTGKNDQECLGDILVNEKLSDDIRKCKLAKMFVYPPHEYANGSWIGDKSSIYFFHANHVIGRHDKIELLKKVNAWVEN